MPTHPDLARLWTDPTAPILQEDDARWTQLNCPVCAKEDRGPGYLHLKLGNMVIWPDLDEYDSPTGLRGEYIILPMECEHGCQIGLAITNHKGAQYLSVLTYHGRTL